MAGRPNPKALCIIASFILVSLSGCTQEDDHTEVPQVTGPEPAPSTLDGKKIDRVVANQGYRITGGYVGAAVTLGSSSAVDVKFVDVQDGDGAKPQDRASLAVDARETGLTVLVNFRQMTGGAGSGDPAATDYRGAVGFGIPVFGDTGRGPSTLPKTTAYAWTAGFARLQVNGAIQSVYPLAWVALTQGLRGVDGGAALTTPAATNLQLHVILPGKLLDASKRIDAAPEGFLYYVFEKIETRTLTDAERATVGNDLLPPVFINHAPVAAFSMLVGTTSTDRGTREENNQLQVTLDGSASRDPDGGDEVKSYTWRVYVRAANGTLQPPEGTPAIVTGKTVVYNFTIEGPKVIDLTVRDGHGGFANLSKPFYVNRHRVFPSDIDANLHAMTLSGYLECKPSVNCFPHRFEVEPRVQSGTLKFIDGGSTVLQAPHIDLFAPGDAPSDPPADADGDNPIATVAGDQLDVAKDDFVGAGDYDAWVWWEQGSQVTYTLDVLLNYAPATT